MERGYIVQGSCLSIKHTALKKIKYVMIQSFMPRLHFKTQCNCTIQNITSIWKETKCAGPDIQQIAPSSIFTPYAFLLAAIIVW